MTFTCKSVTFEMTGFPNANKNTVKLKLRVDNVITQETTFVFNGPTASYSFYYSLSPGHHGLDGRATWITNGARGGVDVTLAKGINCGTEPDFSIEKLQKFSGGSTYTKEKLIDKPGQLGTVEYEIVVKNTGNTPLKFSELKDPKCDPGTITGGPGEESIPPAPGGGSNFPSTVFFCKHVLTKADKEAGFYTNTAWIIGDPPEGGPKEKESNTVEVELVPVEPAFTIEKLQKLEAFGKFPTSGPYTKETLALGHVGQTVAYEVIVKNTGNVPLVFGPFVDPKCDGGTIMGGPGSTPVQPGGSTTYTCRHVLTTADQEAGKYTNTATDTGTTEEGTEITHESNTVVVELPKPNDHQEFSCKALTFVLTGFPNVNGNTVTIQVRVDNVIIARETVTFNGPTLVYVYHLNLSPGHHSLDGRAIWNTHQFSGNSDQSLSKGITCSAEPAMTVQKEQKLAGSSNAFTTSPISGEVGQEVEYEVVVKNTGNVPLTLGSLADAGCDEGTVSGPGTNPLNSEATTSYTCKHKLTLADHEAGKFSNTATVTGTPPQGDGPPLQVGSNTVVVEPVTFTPAPSYTLTDLQRDSSTEPFTESPITGEVGQTIEYEIVVKNTGNVPLTLTEFSNPNCEESTISGPSDNPVVPGGTAEYTCSHVITEADKEAGARLDQAATVADPPPGDGAPITEDSNTVDANIT